MQGDSARKWIGGHIKDLIECCPRSVPVADVVTIQLAQITQWSRVSRVHELRLVIKFFCRQIAGVVFGTEAATHGQFDLSALARVKNRRGKYRSLGYARDFGYAQYF